MKKYLKIQYILQRNENFKNYKNDYNKVLSHIKNYNEIYLIFDNNINN